MWRFHMPTEVFFGEGVVLGRGELLTKFGKKALIVTGRSSSKKNGSLDDVIGALEKFGIEYAVFDEVEENPSFNSVRKAVKEYRGIGFDFVVGIGGGSPLDFAKALAILLVEDVDVEDLYTENRRWRAVPVVAVPTTAGTGSEVTQLSVLTDDLGNKRGCQTVFPALAFLDPRYVYHLSEDLTLTTGVDALCHAVEGFLSKRATPPSDALALHAMKITFENLPKALRGVNEARQNMLIASNLAGMVISQTGTTIAHALGYPLTTEKSVRHGAATGMVLPFVIEVMKEENPEKVHKVNEIFGGNLLVFLESLGLYKIKVDVTEDEIARWAEKAMKAKHLAHTPGAFTAEKIAKIYKEALKT